MAQSDHAAKPGFFQRIGRWFKELFSELKKVTWPKFPVVVKKLGIVLMVVAIFLVFITALDFGLGKLYELLVRYGS